jgi:uncharacterized protein YbaP (TraB family)
MRKQVFVSILVIIAMVSLGSFGQLRAEKSFLWKVESEGKGNGYLLGSIHLLKKEHYPLRQAIEDAFGESDTLLVEADISGSKGMQEGMKLLKKGMYQDEQTLKDNISEKSYRLAEEKLKTMGMDISAFSKYKPWMVAFTVLTVQLMKLGFDARYGVDKYFLDKAAGKKEILELEGLGFQLKMIESFSKEEMEKFMLSSILEADQLGKEMDRMVNAWIKGDVESLGKMFTEGVDNFPELQSFYEKLNDQRNVGMTEKIAKFLQQGKKCFAVVGAAHMIGEKGIVKLLRDKGYTVTQL